MNFKKTKFLRYQIVEYDKKIFLIDLDTNKTREKISPEILNFNYQATQLDIKQYNLLIKSKKEHKNKSNISFSVAVSALIGGGIGKILFETIGVSNANEILIIGKGHSEILLIILMLSILILALSRFFISVINKRKYQQLGINFKGILSLKTEKKVSNLSNFNSRMSLIYLIFILIGLFALYINGLGVIITFPIILLICYLLIYGNRSRDNEIGLLGNRNLIDIHYEELLLKRKR